MPRPGVGPKSFLEDPTAFGRGLEPGAWKPYQLVDEQRVEAAKWQDEVMRTLRVALRTQQHGSFAASLGWRASRFSELLNGNAWANLWEALVLAERTGRPVRPREVKARALDLIGNVTLKLREEREPFVR